MRTLKERLDAKIDRSAGDDSCWPWLASVDSKGYGQIKIDGVTRRAHRVVWETYVGEIPDGKLVLHRCDNRWCTNYERCLFLGTHRDNTLDMYAKGRHPIETARGVAHGCAKLTESDVVDIRRRRAAGESYRLIARRYAITAANARRIAMRETWRHVTAP